MTRRVAQGALLRPRMTRSISVLIASAISRWVVCPFCDAPRLNSRARSWASSWIRFRRVGNDTARAIRHRRSVAATFSVGYPRQIVPVHGAYRELCQGGGLGQGRCDDEGGRTCAALAEPISGLSVTISTCAETQRTHHRSRIHARNRRLICEIVTTNHTHEFAMASLPELGESQITRQRLKVLLA